MIYQNIFILSVSFHFLKAQKRRMEKTWLMKKKREREKERKKERGNEGNPFPGALYKLFDPFFLYIYLCHTLDQVLFSFFPSSSLPFSPFTYSLSLSLIQSLCDLLPFLPSIPMLKMPPLLYASIFFTLA